MNEETPAEAAKPEPPPRKAVVPEKPEAAPAPATEPDPVPEAEPAQRDRPRWLLQVIVIAIIAALGTGLWLSYRPVPDQIQGMVDARELRVTSKVTGRIAAFHVEEGQAVRAGQLLYTITSPEVAAKEQQADRKSVV